MPMPLSEIERLIKLALPDAKVEIIPLADDNDHYAATVVSSEFAGKSKLQQHQLVYNALGGAMGTALHALQLQTFPPK
ncbi:MAG: BolA family transcriptional regulator [Beijerinckiaceae bacterium]|nr:BolA family transcriptional regulator [Beijerinckiaceae bacterium]MCI0736881.1 BolA family transcriptional regulator [Beijerinckiaceae bacterium]